MQHALLGIALLGCALFSSACVAADNGPDGAAKRPPNVVFILADDLGWSDLGCYGGTFYETPCIDRLAAQGVRFTSAYAACPVCSPSRAAVMSGKNPARIGMTAHIGDPGPKQWRRDTPLLPAESLDRLPLEERTLAEAFRDAGYATLHAGKWHLGGEHYWPEYQGFDVNAGGWSQGGPFTGHGYFSPYGNPRLTDGPPGEHLPDRLAEEAVRFAQAHRFKPFFIHLAFYSVHVPLQAPDDLVAKYEAKRRAAGFSSDEMRQTPDGPVRVRQDHAIYAAMVESMDRAVGRVMAGLEEAGVAQNTIVVFTSDNGGLSTGDVAISADEGWPTTNAPLRAGKGWLYEGGIRVPLIVKAPATGRVGAACDRVVSGADHYATLLTLAGLPPDPRQARDSDDYAVSVQAAPEHGPEQRAPVFWHYPHYGNQGGRPGSAVRSGDWKLIEWYGVDSAHNTLELYNLADDLAESHNLAAAAPDRRDQLHAALVEWRQSLAVRMPTPQTPVVAEEHPTPRAAHAAEAAPPR
ncbi:sulfatase [Pirellulimonas nuda]|uniref:sulfatase n=1 Tax=Pirellulimonas nuda TaxID=2528009 RepID=UPI0018D2C26B|nr:sulfatase [Pirellulimonas nuda]